MTVLQISPAIPSLGIPRGHPCSAAISVEDECGATPASLYRRSCGVLSHTRQVWLCPVHATMAGMGNAICRECIRRGGISLVRLERLSMPVRLG